MSVEGLPADQRAVIQLILTQGRSYADLAGMLQSTPEGIRERGRTALTTLADGRDVPPDVADYLLNQQDDAAQAATRERIASSPETHATVVALVRLLAGQFRGSMPQIPLLRTEPVEVAEPEPVAAATVEAGPRTSLIGGAVLIVAVLALAAAVVIWAVNRDDDDGGDDGATATATAGPTGTAGADQPVPIAQLPMRGPAGSDAQGGMIVFVDPAQPDSLFFQVIGQGLKPNTEGNAYAVWLTGGGKPRLLGFAPPVAEDGALGVQGPGEDTDPKDLPGLLDAAKRVVVTRETAERPSKPGEIVLSGLKSELQDLTQQQGGGAAPTATATP